LTANAPKELREIFGATGASQFSSISFEFCSAAVVRTWLNSAVFDARFWKFSAGEAELSDGGIPPKGVWPAFVSAVVFARNIRITTASAPQSPPALIQTIHPIVVQPGVLQLDAPPAQLAAPAAHPVMMMVRPMMAAPAATEVLASGVVVAQANHPPPPPPRAVSVNPALRLNAAIYRLPTAAPGPVASHVAWAPPPDDQVSILAFICRSLPRSPNPDPALPW
jgi:hypothetical protein